MALASDDLRGIVPLEIISVAVPQIDGLPVTFCVSGFSGITVRSNLPIRIVSRVKRAAVLLELVGEDERVRLAVKALAGEGV